MYIPINTKNTSQLANSFRICFKNNNSYRESNRDSKQKYNKNQILKHTRLSSDGVTPQNMLKQRVIF